MLEVTLNGTHGGPLKSKNSVSDDTSGYSQSKGTSVICSAAYCHSDGKGIFATTPDWYGGSFAGDPCGNCHLNSPSSVPHAKHVVGIHYNNIYTGTTGLATPGTLVTNSHGNPTSSTTINCNICHNNTVTSSANDQNTACVSCHNGTTAPLKGNAAIADKSYHVNGTVDIKFDEVNLVKSKAQIRDSISSVPELGNNWTRLANSYKTGAMPNDTAKATLNTANWSSTDTVSCFSCHAALP
jgi:predicted CxxxxCH...CXXCH cytochrome family protein